jgi:hypothetical protein
MRVPQQQLNDLALELYLFIRLVRRPKRVMRIRGDIQYQNASQPEKYFACHEAIPL